MRWPVISCIMHKDDLLMLHNCMSYAEGNKEELANLIESMKAIDAVLHGIITDHAKDKTLDTRIDSGEVWLTGGQAAEMFDHVVLQDPVKNLIWCGSGICWGNT